MILIGSRAISYCYSDFREPNDTDWVVKTKDNRACPGVEFHANEDVYNLLLPHSWGQGDYSTITMDALYTLKVSHSFWDINWYKHMRDIKFLQSKNCTLIPELYDALYPIWEAKHGRKKAYLDKSNEDFFVDSVQRTYIHDDIHTAIAYGPAPLYTKFKRDQSKALISRRMFSDASRSDQLNLAREELYVTALERFCIPKDFVINPGQAYLHAAKQLVTSMSKGWFPKFIVENWSVLSRPDIDYMKKFKENINAR